MASTIVDRIMNVEIVCLCPKMDIVALVTRDGALVINRTTSWQRPIAPVEVVAAGAISALCWSPDGRLLAVGHCQGALSMFDVGAEKLAGHSDASWRKEIMHSHKITLMWWAQQLCPQIHNSSRLFTDMESAELTASLRVWTAKSNTSIHDTGWLHARRAFLVAATADFSFLCEC